MYNYVTNKIFIYLIFILDILTVESEEVIPAMCS